MAEMESHRVLLEVLLPGVLQWKHVEELGTRFTAL